MSWYYAKRGVRQGPVEEAEIRRLAEAGVIEPDDLLWTPEFGETWRSARDVPGLSFGTPCAVPPPPPPVAASGQNPDVIPSVAPLSDGPFRSATHNRDLMAAARDTLRGNWGIAVGVMLVIGLIDLALNLLGRIPLVGLLFALAGILISGSLRLGVATFLLSLSRAGFGTMEQAFSGFQRFGVAFLTSLLVGIFVFLWFLLLIIPAIIAGIRYSQVWFILNDNPQLGAMDAIRRSKQLMQGNKWKYFCLQWRFFWWSLLCLLTLGIGFLWLTPYVAMSNAKFYDDLKSAR